MADIVYKLDPEIILGQDTLNRAGPVAFALGSRVLVAAEQILYENNTIEKLLSILAEAGIDAILYDAISSQATADAAQTAADLARAARCDAVIGFGGLKTQSIARLAAIAAVSDFRIFDFLDGRTEEKRFLPYMAIPAAGADPFLFTPYFIAVDPRDRAAKLIKSPPGHCRAAIIDINLSESMNDKTIATTVFDGLCSAVEAYCSTKANFFSDALLERAVLLYCRVLVSVSEGRNFEIASNIVNAGVLLALGSALSAPGIGTALSCALSGKFPVAKSWCATVMLPHIMEKLIAVRPDKMAALASAAFASVMGESTEGASLSDIANMAVDTVRRYMGKLQVPARLKEFNLSLERLAPSAESARNLEFASFSPWTVSSDDAFDILKQAF